MHGFLTAVVQNLNDNWSVHLADRNRRWPNHRGLPVRDGKAYAMLDPSEADLDLFIGHPVTCNERDLRITVSWKEPGKWFVEAHNPADNAARVKLETDPHWSAFQLRETVRLDPGTSRVWEVNEE